MVVSSDGLACRGRPGDQSLGNGTKIAKTVQSLHADPVKAVARNPRHVALDTFGALLDVAAQVEIESKV